LANLGVGIIIAFVFSWKLTLAIFAFMPFLGIASYVEMKVFSGGNPSDKTLQEESGKVNVIPEIMLLAPKYKPLLQ